MIIHSCLAFQGKYRLGTSLRSLRSLCRPPRLFSYNSVYRIPSLTLNDLPSADLPYMHTQSTPSQPLSPNPYDPSPSATLCSTHRYAHSTLSRPRGSIPTNMCEPSPNTPPPTPHTQPPLTSSTPHADPCPTPIPILGSGIHERGYDHFANRLQDPQ